VPFGNPLVAFQDDTIVLLSFSFFAQTFRLPTFTHDGAFPRVILHVRCARLIARDKMRKSVRAAQQWLPDYGQATFACTNPSIATRNSVENFSVISHACNSSDKKTLFLLLLLIIT